MGELRSEPFHLGVSKIQQITPKNKNVESTRNPKSKEIYMKLKEIKIKFA